MGTDRKCYKGKFPYFNEIQLRYKMTLMGFSKCRVWWTESCVTGRRKVK